jgi:hypothetical protein
MGDDALAFSQTRSIDVWAYREAANRKGLSWAA